MDLGDEEFVIPYPPDSPRTLAEKDIKYTQWFEAAYEGNARLLEMWVEHMQNWNINRRGRAIQYEKYYETRNAYQEQFFHFYYENYFGERVEDTTEYYGINVLAKRSLDSKQRWRQGFNALEFAAIMGRYDAVITLIRMGAVDYSLIEKFDRNALATIRLAQEELEQILEAQLEQEVEELKKEYEDVDDQYNAFVQRYTKQREFKHKTVNEHKENLQMQIALIEEQNRFIMEEKWELLEEKEKLQRLISEHLYPVLKETFEEREKHIRAQRQEKEELEKEKQTKYFGLRQKVLKILLEAADREYAQTQLDEEQQLRELEEKKQILQTILLTYWRGVVGKLQQWKASRKNLQQWKLIELQLQQWKSLQLKDLEEQRKVIKLLRHRNNKEMKDTQETRIRVQKERVEFEAQIIELNKEINALREEVDQLRAEEAAPRLEQQRIQEEAEAEEERLRKIDPRAADLLKRSKQAQEKTRKAKKPKPKTQKKKQTQTVLDEEDDEINE